MALRCFGTSAAAVGTLRGDWLGAGKTITLACLSRPQHRRILARLAVTRHSDRGQMPSAPPRPREASGTSRGPFEVYRFLSTTFIVFCCMGIPKSEAEMTTLSVGRTMRAETYSRSPPSA
jgi:hypothetical protein